MAKLKSSGMKRLQWKLEAEMTANLSPGFSKDWSKVLEMEIHFRGEKRRYCLVLNEFECDLLAKVLANKTGLKG